MEQEINDYHEKQIQNNKFKLCNIPILDTSQLFWLEDLGEGGFGLVKKAYDKIKCEFIALKKFKKLEKQNSSENIFQQILKEDQIFSIIE